MRFFSIYFTNYRGEENHSLYQGLRYTEVRYIKVPLYIQKWPRFHQVTYTVYSMFILINVAVHSHCMPLQITAEGTLYVNDYKVSLGHMGGNSLRASSPGRSGVRTGKGRRACNYVSGIWISASEKLMQMLIGGDDISDDVITLGSCFSMFVYIRTHLICFALIGRNLTAQLTGSHRGTGGGIWILEM